ncbi:hypothetical protein HID58_074056 [Brassica napus]|uniref:Uncharacterized protein n=1 Tax=Brassica napus TaxID=3708 RepID=A0ABQ7YFP2_BRANA|nr:hypothetical protein HID58_074056 [Brassica napus]
MTTLDDGDSEGENPSGGGGGGGSVSTGTKEGDLVRVSVRDSESREVQGGTLNLDREGKQEESEGERLGATVDYPISIKDDAREKGKQGENSVDVAKDVGLDGRALSELLQDLEAITPPPAIHDSSNGVEVDINHKAFEEQHLKAKEKALEIQLIEPTTEAFHTADTGSWENVHGGRKGTEVGGSQSHQGSQQKRCADEKGITVSPSKFSPLQDTDEDEEEEEEELLKEVEEGEILESKAARKKIQRTQVMSGRRSAAAGKQTRGKVVRSKDLLYVRLQGTSKKASDRKL